MFAGQENVENYATNLYHHSRFNVFVGISDLAVRSSDSLPLFSSPTLFSITVAYHWMNGTVSWSMSFLSLGLQCYLLHPSSELPATTFWPHSNVIPASNLSYHLWLRCHHWLLLWWNLLAYIPSRTGWATIRTQLLWLEKLYGQLTGRWWRWRMSPRYSDFPAGPALSSFLQPQVPLWWSKENRSHF